MRLTVTELKFLVSFDSCQSCDTITHIDKVVTYPAWVRLDIVCHVKKMLICVLVAYFRKRKYCIV